MSGVNEQESDNMSRPLAMHIIAKCSTTKARVGKVILPHSTVDTPVFMPVGTQGTIKGVTSKQLEDADILIILGNTYHLGNKPGPETLQKAGGLHKFMSWNRSLLTDSGGFQMVSLSKLAEFSEEGVNFTHPKDQSEMLLTPEKSIEIQNAIGADIMMQLDDVISSQSTSAERFKLATHRSIRWLDRCLKAHKKPGKQNLFPIIQGGLDQELRKVCLKAMTSRDVNGFAIGGLSGGESKEDFWKMVTVSTEGLPSNKPRYLMGVGYAIDLIVCSALGCDMFDCVFPTRTARFGCALIPTGQIHLNKEIFKTDFSPIDKDCDCSTCKRYTRAFIRMQLRNSCVSACHMISIHNIHFQANLMKSIRESIEKDQFPSFIKSSFAKMFENPSDYPEWACNALHSVGVDLKK